MVSKSDFEDGFTPESSGTFAEFASEIEKHYKTLVSKASVAPKDMYEHYQAFMAAIDWSERWIQILLGSELFLLILVLIFRNSFEFQTILFFIICICISLSERLNSLCASNWKTFSTQNYFDPHGSFAVTMFSGPLLFIGFIQVIIFLKLTSSELIKAKRLELRHKALQSKNISNSVDISENTAEKSKKND